MLAEVAEGQRIETTAGLGVGANLHPLQEAFMEHFAAQCGFCTPGMLMIAIDLVHSTPNITRDEIRIRGVDPAADNGGGRRW